MKALLYYSFINLNSRIYLTYKMLFIIFFMFADSSFSFSQSGTIIFSAPNRTNLGIVLHDGTYSNDIENIELSIFGANNYTDAINNTTRGSFAFYDVTIEPVSNLQSNFFGLLDVTEGSVAINIYSIPKIVVIKSNDGAEFHFKSIYVGDYAWNSPIRFEGLRDGVSTGTVDLIINNIRKEEYFSERNGLTLSIFRNVDEIRITNQYSGNMQWGVIAAFNNIEIGPAIKETSLDRVFASNHIKLNSNYSNKELSFTGIREQSDLVIADLMGRPILSTKINNNEKVNITSLNKGIYFAILIVNGETYTERFIKM